MNLYTLSRLRHYTHACPRTHLSGLLLQVCSIIVVVFIVVIQIVHILKAQKTNLITKIQHIYEESFAAIQNSLRPKYVAALWHMHDTRKRTVQPLLSLSLSLSLSRTHTHTHTHTHAHMHTNTSLSHTYTHLHHFLFVEQEPSQRRGLVPELCACVGGGYGHRVLCVVRCFGVWRQGYLAGGLQCVVRGSVCRRVTM